MEDTWQQINGHKKQIEVAVQCKVGPEAVGSNLEACVSVARAPAGRAAGSILVKAAPSGVGE